ncbi:hypothetical protein AVEN_83754-1 [Araneus ventricosus]|uniref:Uncharacterized protein n=1 Tax=Araneus ventricosus TaxID=182803 RepID=A0A4Y1ZZH3_ARAVE|nr:hypothetical protein AVEN_83754-1 [Araneus ventricosus]
MKIVLQVAAPLNLNVNTMYVSQEENSNGVSFTPLKLFFLLEETNNTFIRASFATHIVVYDSTSKNQCKFCITKIEPSLGLESSVVRKKNVSEWTLIVTAATKLAVTSCSYA